MKIVHFSDWFGKLQELPKADLYLCTGNMYPVVGNTLEEVKKNQKKWLDNVAGNGAFKKYFKTPGAFIICISGSTDFISLSTLFYNNRVEITKPGEIFYNNRVEITKPGEVLNFIFDEVNVSFSGIKGIDPKPISGEINNDVDFSKFLEHKGKNKSDILLTNTAPKYILDSIKEEKYQKYHGSSCLYDHHCNVIIDNVNFKKPKLWAFGHIARNDVLIKDGIIFSNAYGSYNEITLSF